MQREVQNIGVSARMAMSLVMVIKLLVYSVTLSTKVTIATHSTVPYLVNSASGSAQVLIIYTLWKQVRFIFAGGCFGIMFCARGAKTHYTGNHIIVLSGVPLPAYVKSAQLRNRLKKHSKECMNAFSTQRYTSISSTQAQILNASDTLVQYSQGKLLRAHIERSINSICLVAKRLKCVKLIPPRQLQHEGSHDHSLDLDVVHYCQARSDNSVACVSPANVRTGVRVAGITVHFPRVYDFPT